MSAPLLDAAGAALDAAAGRFLAEALIRGVTDTVDAAVRTRPSHEGQNWQRWFSRSRPWSSVRHQTGAYSAQGPGRAVSRVGLTDAGSMRLQPATSLSG